MNVADVRTEFRMRHSSGEFTAGTVEIVAASFLADEETIFGKVNEAYVAQELEWYHSQSLKLFPDAPKIWKACAGHDGTVNSNYGWCLFSRENGDQYGHVYAKLRDNPSSRQAVAIYTRPSMHTDASANGKRDFMCTNTVQYLLREKLHCVVQMRSSDAVLGYRNDLAWHRLVLKQLVSDLAVSEGSIFWQAASLHVYERHYGYLV